ncbi:MAG TPA: hypothetical protein VM582_07320 [Candidatus Thermoplasmatota archaeon]|nr:hypothetical protein [Candidatus Thermoplasmatota archaeon]
MPVALDYKSDHLVVRLVGSSVLTAMRRNVVVPFSDITRVEVEAPQWPSLVKEWRVGTHLPGVIAHGLFSTWDGTRKRFLHYNKGTARVLTLHLEGHPDFHEISVEVRDPDAAQKEIAGRTAR